MDVEDQLDADAAAAAATAAASAAAALPPLPPQQPAKFPTEVYWPYSDPGFSSGPTSGK